MVIKILDTEEGMREIKVNSYIFVIRHSVNDHAIY